MYTKYTYQYMPKKMAKKLIVVIASGEGESEDLWWEEEFSLCCLPFAWIRMLNTRWDSCLYYYMEHISKEQRWTSAKFQNTMLKKW